MDERPFMLEMHKSIHEVTAAVQRKSSGGSGKAVEMKERALSQTLFTQPKILHKFGKVRIIGKRPDKCG